MKTVILIVVGLFLVFFFIGKTSISLSPFSIKIEQPFYAAAWVILIITFGVAMGLTYHQGYTNGVRIGRLEERVELINMIHDIRDEMKEDKDVPAQSKSTDQVHAN